jgi:RNA polymerase sigma-70 factor (ECF subfamily)
VSQSQAEFADLIVRVRNDDGAALAELMGLYEPEIRRTAHFCLGDTLRPFLDSMDLVQSVHRSVLAGIRHNKLEFSGPDNLIRLVVSMVHRKVAEQWRRPEASRPMHAGSLNLEETLVSLSSSGCDPARVVETRDLVLHILRDLNDIERRLLELRLQNYSTPEAAEEMHLDPAYLRVCLHRLRKRLRGLNIPPECL